MFKKLSLISKRHILFSIFIVSAVLFSSCKPITNVLPTQEEQTVEQTNLEESASEVTATNQPAKTEYSFTATEDGQVALDLVEYESKSESSPLKIETVDYGTAGKFISSINGLTGNSQNYWAFYINGEYAQAGASQTILKKGDIITFTYEEVTL